MIDIPIRSGKSELWIEDRHRDVHSMGFRVVGVVFSGTSPFQHVEILETAGMGRMLLNDGIIMITERDEFVYHEMMAHVPLFTHPSPRRVLVVGGGDGGTVREVLRHPAVERCRMVEIDAMVVEACREHIPSTAGSLDDPRVDLTIGDAVAFVGETEERYDVVLVDSSDPVGPAKSLFGVEFYRNVHRVLWEGGIVVSQGESPFYEGTAQKELLGVLGEVFEHRHLYNFTNMTYPGGLWSFTAASHGLCPVRDFDPARVPAAGIRFRYYNERVHRASFALPQFVIDDYEGLLSSP